MENIVLVSQGGGRYLFSVPDGISLKEGERVKCDTRRGAQDGTVWADSVCVEPDIAKLIGKLVGASYPLKSVVGRMEYREFERAEIPHKYNIGAEVTVNNCGKQFSKYRGWFYAAGVDMDISVRYNGGCLKDGDIVKVLAFGEHGEISRYSTLYAVEKPDGRVGLISEDGLSEKPQFYTGKVVCVDNGNDRCLAVGKVYAVENGVMCWNDGDPMKWRFKSFDDINRVFREVAQVTHAKFIEFKGE